MSILIKDLPLGGYEISIMKDGERYRARVDGIWCEVEEIPTTDTDSDTISRQAAIDALDGEIEITGRTNAEAVKGYVRLVKDRLERLPPAQPERKKGKWIKDANRWMCDKCGELVMDDDHNFCPNCGVDMREVTE